ncbi:hypothetical protein DPMN_011130 [Dreissena polymorpha]|uniref:Uncharacterized protein n=1 Tax=Dreissena polymorpha TaxID=45954 RepID=A0A9D4S1J9_DREPO|nr:hypothetical protein DPMN_011130 [Dreissena polymorpha]
MVLCEYNKPMWLSVRAVVGTLASNAEDPSSTVLTKTTLIRVPGSTTIWLMVTLLDSWGFLRLLRPPHTT